MSMDSVILMDQRGGKRLVRLGEGMLKVDGLGVLDSAKLSSAIGKSVEIAGRKFLVLSASLLDHLEHMERGAQIITAKDSASIVQRCDIGTGDLVVEGGAGSGALTVVLARAVSPNGRVVSYDLRAEFAETARRNVERAGLSPVLELKIADINAGISERNAKAVVLDLPEPWRALAVAWEALAPCGHIGSYSPTMEQVKETVRVMRTLPFVDFRTTEIIEREIEVKETGTRPAFAALGHTGYITTARKVLETL